MNFNIGYGKRIRDLRKARKLKQVALAKELGVNQNQISQWENEQDRPINYITAIAEFFKVSVEWILNGERALLRNPRKRNERDSLAAYPMKKANGRKAVPAWLGLAAGPGKELRQCPEAFVFDTLNNTGDVHAAFIQGDSMADTLQDGDCVVLRAFGDGLRLEVLEPGEVKGPLKRLESDIPDDSICVLSINDEPPTLKRIHYQKGIDWSILIEADNPLAWRTRPIRRHDTLTIYAKVLGRGETGR